MAKKAPLRKTPFVHVERMVMDSGPRQALTEAEHHRDVIYTRLQAVRKDDLESLGRHPRTGMPLQSQLQTALEEQFDHAEQAVNDAADALDNVTVEYRFKALPPRVFELLVKRHPATEEQQAAVGKLAANNALAKAAAQRIQYNPQTFPPVLISRTLVEPVMTPQEVIDEIWGDESVIALDLTDETLTLEEIEAELDRLDADIAENGLRGFDAWNQTDRHTMFQAAMGVCQAMASAGLPR